MGKKVLAVAVLMICALSLALIGCGNSASKSNSSAPASSSSQAFENVTGGTERSYIVFAIEKQINDSAMQYPDEKEWTIVKSNKDDATKGMISASCTAKKGNSNSVVSAWLEGSKGTYSIHYIETKDGVILDDGVIPE